MRRRAFVRGAAAAAAGAALAPGRAAASLGAAVGADLVLRGGLVVDGTGAAAFEGDVAIAGDRIAAVGRRLSVTGAVELDARGLVVAPGFVDIHSHTDTDLLVDPRAPSKVRQGVTTEVAGADGGSMGPWTPAQAAAERAALRARYGIDVAFDDLAGFFAAIERRGAAVNLASMVGAGQVRAFVMGDDDRPPTAAELRRMVAEVERALAAGACGLSTGLEYTPGGFAAPDELVALAAALRGTGLPYASHLRNEDDRLFAAVEEALNVGAFAGVPVQVSHLKAQGERNWWKAGPALETLAGARAGGLDVAFDVYPYVAFSTGLANLFPLAARDGGAEAFRARLRDPAQLPALERAARDKVASLGSWDSVQVTSTADARFGWLAGRRLGAAAAERGVDPFALLLDVMLAGGGGMVGFGMSEANVARFLAHPLAIVCSDGSALAVDGPLAAGTPHPRNFGAFPRVLARYVRELGALGLEDAVRKMTSAPADRVRLRDRGRLAPGMLADVVAFDPERVADRATFEAPHAYPAGIPHVLVNGRFVLRDGEATGELPGRVLRANERA